MSKDVPKKTKPKPKLDPRLKEVIRRPWREFIRIEDEDHCLAIARFYLGTPKATAEDFTRLTGITLLDHKGCYMESGAANAPTGPVLPGPVKRVLAFKQSRSGRWITKLFTLPGLFHESLTRAWIKVDDWERAIGDEHYFEEVFLTGKDLRGRTDAKKEEH
jgi:hypothetical protein